MAICNPQTLLASAACFECVSPGMWEVLELQLLCEILGVGGGGTINIQSQSVALDNTTNLYKVAHGLAFTPRIARAVLVATTGGDASGYSLNQEIEVYGIKNTSRVPYMGFLVYADPTYVYCAIPGVVLVGNESSYAVTNPSGGGIPTNFGSFNNFQMKFYYA